MSQINFDATQVPPDSGQLDPVPAGWYDVVVTKSEMKPTKDSATTGNAYLQIEASIISGTYQGRKLFDRFNLRNQNAQAQEIAYKQFSALCHAVNVLHVQNSEQIHNIPFKVKVKIVPAQGIYEAKNEIGAYRPANFVTDTSEPVAPGGQPPMMPPKAFVAPPPAQTWAQAPAQQFAPAPAPVPAPVPAQPPQAPAWQGAPQQPWGAAPAPMQAPEPAPAPVPAQPQAAPPWAAAQGAVPPWARQS